MSGGCFANRWASSSNTLCLPSRAWLPTEGLEGAGDARPIHRGVVQDWDLMETYWDHVFTNMLGVDTEQCNVIVTANTFETKDNRERETTSTANTTTAQLRGA